VSKYDLIRATLTVLEVAENERMAKTPAERQAEFKQAMKEAGFVRLEAYVTREQREKFRQLGGDAWLRERIERAKVKAP
jgi:hypothetical protein